MQVQYTKRAWGNTNCSKWVYLWIVESRGLPISDSYYLNMNEQPGRKSNGTFFRMVLHSVAVKHNNVGVLLRQCSKKIVAGYASTIIQFAVKRSTCESSYLWDCPTLITCTCRCKKIGLIRHILSSGPTPCNRQSQQRLNLIETID